MQERYTYPTFPLVLLARRQSHGKHPLNEDDGKRFRGSLYPLDVPAFTIGPASLPETKTKKRFATLATFCRTSSHIYFRRLAVSIIAQAKRPRWVDDRLDGGN